MATLELLETVEATAKELAREPQSPHLGDSMTQMIRRLDEFLGSSDMKKVGRLPAQQRSSLGALVVRVVDLLRDMLTVAAQIAQLGGHVPWGVDLARAIGRAQQTLAERGLPARASRRPLSKVTREPSRQVAEPGAFIVHTSSRPESQLERYVDVAVHTVQPRPREIEPGHWYVDLDGFPGVWADGRTANECLDALADVLQDWLVVKLVHGDRDIPVVGDLNLTASMRD